MNKKVKSCKNGQDIDHWYPEYTILQFPKIQLFLDKFESVQRSAVKYILNEEDIDYNPTDYLSRLRDLNLLPMEYYFMHNDLLVEVVTFWSEWK